MNHFVELGRSLIANGYLVVPIYPGQKSPALKGWQNSRLGVDDLARWPGHGVGIITGVGEHPVVGIDIDVSHPTIGPAIVDWCREHLGLGAERVGAAPRLLIAYRAAAAGWTKGNSVVFFDPADPLKPSGKENNQSVEVLGYGQQFVAYHVHPDTQREYEWTDLFGGLLTTAARELPVVTETQIEELMLFVGRTVRMTSGVQVVQSNGTMVGAAHADDDLFGLSPKTGVPISDVDRLLAGIDNTRGVDYDTWFRVGMALHHEYDGSDEAYAAWSRWSSKSPKHVERETRYKWSSFGKSPGKNPITLRWVLKVSSQAISDAEIDARRAVLHEIREIIDLATDSVDLTTRVAKQVKPLMPEEPAARSEIFGLFQQRFRALSHTSLPLVEVRKLLLTQAAPTVKQRRPLTEFGNADRMVDRYGHALMYVPETDGWHAWNGVYWRPCTKVEIQHYAKETIRSLLSEVDDHTDQSEFFEFCKMSQQARMVGNMVSLVASDPVVCVPATELDKHRHLLGVKNGVVDLRSGKLLPPDPSYRITMICGCEYDPNAQAPLFMQTVLDVFYGSKPDAEFFMALVGYSAMGEPKEDILVIPYGNGANGKSTVLGCVRDAFGGYARAADASSFVSDPRGVSSGSAGGPREDLVRLRGARFVYVSEPDESSELREGAVKAMTGGDAITARGIQAKRSIEIVPTWVPFMPTNHKPVVRGGDFGIWRRIVPIPFLRNFRAEGVAEDKERPEKLRRELPGVLALIVKAAIRYQQLGLPLSATVESARDSYRSQMDVLSEWIEECTEQSPEYEEEAQRLWRSWDAFARERGITSIKNSVSFGRRLDNRFPGGKGSRGVRIRKGIRLRQGGGEPDLELLFG